MALLASSVEPWKGVGEDPLKVLQPLLEGADESLKQREAECWSWTRRVRQRDWGGALVSWDNVGVGRARAPWWRRAHRMSHLGTLHTIRVCNTM